MENGPSQREQRERTVNYEKELNPNILKARLYVDAGTQIELEMTKFRLELEKRRAAGLVGNLQNTLLLRSNGKVTEGDIFADPLNKMRLDQAEAESFTRESAAKEQLDELKVVARATAEHQSAVIEAMLAKGISGAEIAAIQKQAMEAEKEKFYKEYQLAYQNHMVDRVNCSLTVGSERVMREAGRQSNASLLEVQDMIDMGKQIFGVDRMGKMGKIELQVREGMQKGILDNVASMAVAEKNYHEILDQIKGTEMYNQINARLWQVHMDRLKVEQVLKVEFDVNSADIDQVKRVALNPEEAKRMVTEQKAAKVEGKERWDKRVVNWAKKWARSLGGAQTGMRTAEAVV